MDALLAQAARYSAGLAIRSGISIAGGFAIRQVSTYISKVPQNSKKDELELVSKRLDQKIKIVTPAIDLIEIIAARGNTTLNSTVQLTVSLRNDINAFGKRMAEVMDGGPDASQGSKEATQHIIADMKSLLARIEDAVPLISLALTTSGANLSASLPDTVSPSRLLQASSFLQSADLKFDQKSDAEVQVGPSFSLKLYTIFEGHSRQSQDPNLSNITWQETYARAILEIIRMPMNADIGHDLSNADHKLEYLYHFRITEDLDDGRYHEELDSSTLRRDKQGFHRGASRDIPVHNIARLFFSASGRLLNIEEARTPVLVLKINHKLRGPSALIRAIFTGDASSQNDGELVEADPADHTSPDDLEWLALELWADEEELNSDVDQFDTASETSGDLEAAEGALTSPANTRQAEAEAHSDHATGVNTTENDIDILAMQMQVLDMSRSMAISPKSGVVQTDVATLSLMEYILRLSALQTSEQDSVLSISDERISLFLRDDNAQSRSKSHQEAEAVRRRSNERFDTPASSVFYDEFIPGTQMKSRRSRKVRHQTPTTGTSTPSTSAGTTARNLSMGRADSPHITHGRNKEQNDKTSTLQKFPSMTSPTNESPLISKTSRASHARNMFQSYADLQSKTNNGFSSRLRHSIEESPNAKGEPEVTEPESISRKASATTAAEEQAFMARAIEEAKKSVYLPSAFCVGCVIVKQGRILSTGFSRELEGNTHAEQCALDKLSDLGEAEGADLYTTMEPCSVRLSGNVPCIERVIRAKLGRVLQAIPEPADFVECQGSDLLRRAGIQVITVPGYEDLAIQIARGQYVKQPSDSS